MTKPPIRCQAAVWNPPTRWAAPAGRHQCEHQATSVRRNLMVCGTHLRARQVFAYGAIPGEALEAPEDATGDLSQALGTMPPSTSTEEPLP